MCVTYDLVTIGPGGVTPMTLARNEISLMILEGLSLMSQV